MSDSKISESPYVSLGRLRLVQKVLDPSRRKGKDKIDAIFCVLGEDGAYNDGCQDLVNYLLLDAFQVDLKSSLEDEIDDDFMMTIGRNQVHIYCNANNYQQLIDRRDS